MPHRLTERVCVITGATGIAAATATMCADEGAQVFVIAKDETECASLTRSIIGRGGNCEWAVADLRDESATETAVTGCVERFGRIDGLLAVAGASARRHGDGPAHEASLAGFEAAFRLNTVPAFVAAAAVVRRMLDQPPNDNGSRGTIVLMSSVLASSPSALFATHGYAAAKGAIESLARTMAAHYAGRAIRVNAIAPGLVATPMSQRAQADPATIAYITRKQPLAAGLLPAEAAAELAVYLLSDESRYVSGQVIAIDGGWSVTEAPS